MKKGLISAIVVVVIVLIGVLIFSSDDESYVANIENDVIALEEELIEVETMIASDELTEEEATAAYERVLERLVSIETSVESSEGIFLSDEQKQRLVAALQRFQEAIADYSSVLNVLEEAAADVSEVGNRQQLYPGTTIIAQLRNVAEALAEHIEEVISDEDLEEITEEEADSEEDEANEETTTEETDETSTSTDSEATTTEETN